MPANQIVAINWIAWESTIKLLEKHYSQLQHEFSNAFLQQISQRVVVKDHLLSHPAVKSYVSDFYALGNDGILGGLWNFSLLLNKGLYVRMEAIPLLQETIEICEYFDINPYRAPSNNCTLIVTKEATPLIEMATKQNVPASYIGYLTDNNKRILSYDGKEQFLTPPSRHALVAL